MFSLEFFLFFILPLLVHFSVFFIFSFFSLFFDSYLIKTGQWNDYKISNRSTTISKISLYEVVLTNQLFLTPFVTLCCYPFWDKTNIYISFYDYIKLPFVFLIEEILFYYIHRLLHLPVFYQSIHCVHHMVIYPQITATYFSHPIEHCLLNILPVILAPLIMNLSLMVTIVWVFIATANSLVAHMGYKGLSEGHDLHHVRGYGNYGILGLCDWYYNTSIKNNRS